MFPRTPLVIGLTALFACNGPPADDTASVDDTGDGLEIPGEYSFDSRDGSGESSVSYSGQVFRNVLIGDMKTHLGGMTERLDNGDWYPVAGEATAALEFYFAFDSTTSGAVPLLVDTDPAPLQADYDAVSSGKDLVGKIAGNDATGQHRDWSTEFVGWTHDDVTTPESLVRHWFATIDDQAVAWSAGTVPLNALGEPVPNVYVTPEGQDLQQLTEKFLRGAVAFSQGADDYLDDDVDGKGLLADNSAVEEGKSYTALEHGWDEGFGYFGAARTYGEWTDVEIATGYADVDGDGAIDLTTEYSFGHSVNAGKRDRDADPMTDFTGDAWTGFAGGRQLIAQADGALTDAELAELQGYRDQAVLAWESAIAASVVHYINETLVDMDALGTDDYSFGGHAKHWSEMKGFSLSFQFNPRSPMTDAEFAELQTLLGDAPVVGALDDPTVVAHRAALLEARALIGSAYGFDAGNLGDDDGGNGW